MNSVITINFERDEHLNNMLRGFAISNIKPDEIIIVNMGSSPNIQDDFGLPIIIKELGIDEDTFLPIGEARNLGAKLSSFDNLHFLDVDCIPTIDYLEKMQYFLSKCKGLHMGTPRYLLSKLNKIYSTQQLVKNSKHHPKRPKVFGIQKCSDPGLFWSLCFSVNKEVFKQIGGFDPRFKGYGAEDTDLSFTCNKLGIPFYLNEAVVYHQQHGFHSPPLDKLESIVSNSNYFFKKWNHWPMGNYLESFNDNGFIDWNSKQTTNIIVKKLPSNSIIDQHYINDMPYA